MIDSPMGAWEKEREVGAALDELDPEHTLDVLVNRYGDLWAVRPISCRAAEWLAEWIGEDPVEPVFGHYTLPVERRYIVDLIDALLDDGLRVG